MSKYTIYTSRVSQVITKDKQIRNTDSNSVLTLLTLYVLRAFHMKGRREMVDFHYLEIVIFLLET